MVKRGLYVFSGLAMFGLLLSACSGTSKESATEKQDPVELVIYTAGSGIEQENFMEEFGNKLVAKYPYITPKIVSSLNKGPTMADLIASGAPIDLILASTGTLFGDVLNQNLQFDISGMIKQNKFDLTKFEPTTIDMIKKVSNGGIYGLPLYNNVGVLSYNKDLFNKFGVPFPKDGMTWDQTYDIAKRMTRNENGVQYQGFVSSISHLAQINQLSAGYVDPKTGKAWFEPGENWKQFALNLLRFYQIPGNDNGKALNGYSLMMAGTAAMMAHLNGPGMEVKINYDWDAVTLPVMNELPGVGPQPYPQFLFLASTSKHKEAAFQALAYLTSEDVQLVSSKAGRLSALTSKAVRDTYKTGSDFYKGKNNLAHYPKKLAEPRVLTPYDGIASGALNTQLLKLIKGETDVNTALRDAQEAANKAIEADKAAKK